MYKSPFFSSIAERMRESRECLKQKVNEQLDEKSVNDAILKTFNTGLGEYMEKAYVKTKLSTEQFYNAFSNFVRNFDVRDCSTLFLKSVLEFWDNHGLKSQELEGLYRKWGNETWFTLVKVIDYKPFWDWMFSDGIRKLDVSYVLENSDTTFEELIDKIASSDKCVQSVFNRYLDEFLDSVWEAVLKTNELPIEQAISVIVHRFPDEEVKVLNHAYYYLIDYQNAELYRWGNEALLYVIERMADYEYGMDGEFFSEGTPQIPYNRNEGKVNIKFDAKAIVAKFREDILLKDIVWILENRFNVDAEYIEECLFEEFCDIYTSYNLKTLVDSDGYGEDAVLPALFQFSLGYRLFHLFFNDIFEQLYVEELEILEEEYGMVIAMNGTFYKK